MRAPGPPAAGRYWGHSQPSPVSSSVPPTGSGSTGGEGPSVGPGLQVGRVVQEGGGAAVREGGADQHPPAVAVPPDVRVAVHGAALGQLGDEQFASRAEGPAAVVGDGAGDRLVLGRAVLAVRGVEGDEPVAVGDGVAGEAAVGVHAAGGRGQGDRQRLPGQQVGAAEVAPVHVRVGRSVRVVLVEDVVVAVVEDQPVGVVDPVAGRAQVRDGIVRIAGWGGHTRAFRYVRQGPAQLRLRGSWAAALRPGCGIPRSAAAPAVSWGRRGGRTRLVRPRGGCRP